MSGENKMSIFGVGPIFILCTIIYLAVTYFLTLVEPDFFSVKVFSEVILNILGVLCLVIGIPFFALSAASVVLGYPKNELMTGGVYNIVRHPLYSSFIIFIVPGFVLLSKSWLMMTTPVFMYYVFRRLIIKEESYLFYQFGDDYLTYKSRVNAVFPRLGFEFMCGKERNDG